MVHCPLFRLSGLKRPKISRINSGYKAIYLYAE